MWFIIDDQMADDRRIRRLPLATVGLWVKLCVIHSKGVSMQAKDPAAYPGHFDKLDLKDAGGTMKQLQQLIDSGLMGGARRRMASGLRGRHLQGAASVDRRATRGAQKGRKQGRTPQGGQPESQANVWRLARKQPSKRRAKQ